MKQMLYDWEITQGLDYPVLFVHLFLECGLAFALGIDAGMIHINAISVANDPIAPFGGE